VYLHGKKGLGKKDKKRWCCDKILVHLKEFGPFIGSSKVKSQMMMGWWKHNQLDQKNNQHAINYMAFTCKYEVTLNNTLLQY
jgi:hypothetical protein